MMRNRFMFTSDEVADEVAFEARPICLGYLANLGTKGKGNGSSGIVDMALNVAAGANIPRRRQIPVFCVCAPPHGTQCAEPARIIAGRSKGSAARETMEVARAKARISQALRAFMDYAVRVNGVSRYVTDLAAGGRNVTACPTGNRCHGKTRHPEPPLSCRRRRGTQRCIFRQSAVTAASRYSSAVSLLRRTRASPTQGRIAASKRFQLIAALRRLAKSSPCLPQNRTRKTTS
jgi:hypothetical protein